MKSRFAAAVMRFGCSFARQFILEALRRKLHWRGPICEMVRLKDIARHANVSVMTVSKALRDEPDVSAATKSRLKALAKQMGYVPDSSAQGLRTKRPSFSGCSFVHHQSDFCAHCLAIETAP